MEKILVITIAIIIFLTISFIYYKIFNGYYKKKFGKTMWKTWKMKVYFWQGAIFASTGGTILIMFLLKWTNFVTF